MFIVLSFLPLLFVIVNKKMTINTNIANVCRIQDSLYFEILDVHLLISKLNTHVNASLIGRESAVPGQGKHLQVCDNL